MAKKGRRKPKAKPEYWTFWYPPTFAYGFCSKHKSLGAAERAAKKCEKEGGSEHDIYEVRRVR